MLNPDCNVIFYVLTMESGKKSRLEGNKKTHQSGKTMGGGVFNEKLVYYSKLFVSNIGTNLVHENHI